MFTQNSLRTLADRFQLSDPQFTKSKIGPYGPIRKPKAPRISRYWAFRRSGSWIVTAVTVSVFNMLFIFCCSLNREKRIRELLRVTQENQEILRRISLVGLLSIFVYSGSPFSDTISMIVSFSHSPDAQALIQSHPPHIPKFSTYSSQPCSTW